MCQSFYPGGLCITSLPLWLSGPMFLLGSLSRGSLPRGSLLGRPPIQWRAGGTHPTGMLSCLLCNIDSPKESQWFNQQQGILTNNCSVLMNIFWVRETGRPKYEPIGKQKGNKLMPITGSYRSCAQNVPYCYGTNAVTLMQSEGKENWPSLWWCHWVFYFNFLS